LQCPLRLPRLRSLTPELSSRAPTEARWYFTPCERKIVLRRNFLVAHPLRDGRSTHPLARREGYCLPGAREACRVGDHPLSHHHIRRPPPPSRALSPYLPSPLRTIRRRVTGSGDVRGRLAASRETQENRSTSARDCERDTKNRNDHRPPRRSPDPEHADSGPPIPSADQTHTALNPY